MPGWREQAKQARKQATTQSTLRKVRSDGGIDQELTHLKNAYTLRPFAITNGHIEDDGIDGRTLANLAVANAHLQTSAVSNAKLATDCVSNAKMQTDSVSSNNMQDGSVHSNHIDSGLEGGAGSSYRLRRVTGLGSSNDAARTDHNHSVGFKSNLTQDERKAMLADVQDMEAVAENTVPQAMRAMFRVVKRLARMNIDEAEHTAEYLVDFLDNGDALEVHEWRILHEQEYHAREMLLTDPTYRENAYEIPMVRRIAEELGIDYTIPVTTEDYQSRDIALAARLRELEEFPEILINNEQHNPGRYTPGGSTP